MLGLSSSMTHRELVDLSRPVRRLLWLSVLFGGALAATIAGCGGGDDETTPPAGGDATSPAEESPTGPADGTPSAGEVLQLVARDIAFDESELAASAGPLTITMVNEDEGIPHNLHVFRGSDPTGEDVGATEIEAGPVTQSLSLDLSPGTYFFRCDVHPTQMSGTLMVQ